MCKCVLSVCAFALACVQLSHSEWSMYLYGVYPSLALTGFLCPYFGAYVHTILVLGPSAGTVHIYIHRYIATSIHTFMYMHTYIHTYIHTYLHTCMHTYIHACIHTYIYIYIHTYEFLCRKRCVHRSGCICERAYSRAHAHASMHIYMHIYRICVYMCVQQQIHIDVHVHIYIYIIAIVDFQQRLVQNLFHILFLFEFRYV